MKKTLFFVCLMSTMTSINAMYDSGNGGVCRAGAQAPYVLPMCQASLTPSTEILTQEEVVAQLYQGIAPLPQTFLLSVTIPKYVTEIAAHCFEGCQQLVEVYFECESNSRYIGVLAFSKCNSLKRICLPRSLEIIDRDSFAASTQLTAVTFEEDACLKEIRDRAFYMCINLTSINIPDSLQSVGPECFSQCESLTDVRISETSNLRFLGAGAFSSCVSLEGICFPNSLQGIVKPPVVVPKGSSQIWIHKI